MMLPGLVPFCGEKWSDTEELLSETLLTVKIKQEHPIHKWHETDQKLWFHKRYVQMWILQTMAQACTVEEHLSLQYVSTDSSLHITQVSYAYKN